MTPAPYFPQGANTLHEPQYAFRRFSDTTFGLVKTRISRLHLRGYSVWMSKRDFIRLYNATQFRNSRFIRCTAPLTSRPSQSASLISVMSHPRQPYSHVRTDRHKALTTVANETISVLPEILQAIPSIDASASTIYDLGNLASLTPESCPQYTITLDDKSTKPGIITQVVNMDTLDCAIALGNLPRRPSTRPSPQRFPSVCVLNLASDTTPGGGWLRGYLAQEESICYRSSLYLSLHKGYYPLSPTSAIYTNSAVIIRSSYASGKS